MATKSLVVINVRYLIYLTVTEIIFAIRAVWRRFSGNAAMLKRIQDGDLYEMSAQVYDVTFKAKVGEFSTTSARDFFGLKMRLDHPRCVLQDNVSLYAVDKDNATFVVTAPNLDIFHSDHGPFFYLAQYNHAMQYITMPIWAFHRLADEVGDPEVKVILLSNTGRCGSTLVSQMFERCPGVLSVSEPEGISACNNFRLKLPKDEYELLFRSTFRMICKPLQQRDVKCLFIKTRCACVVHIPAVASIFPNVIQLFMYRDYLDTLISWRQTTSETNVLDKIFRFADVPSPSIMFGDTEGMEWMKDEAEQHDFLHYGCLHICWLIYCYLEYQRSGIKIAALKYDDFMKCPHEVCRKLLRHCDIPEKYATDAVKAMQRDSQRGTSFSRQGRNGLKKPAITEELLRKFDGYCRRVGIPLMSESLPLPATITTHFSEQASGDHESSAD
ncbi:uncharacterized protein LOC135493716 [Lineus longissimus]|uniref:uncharacterized protein LOC135493716 n=1 Tax=Lineus longissimus TaxID=88925 RepID=UPI002B4F12CE